MLDTDKIEKSVFSYVNSHKEAIGKNVINGLLLFVVLTMLGCLDFASLTFHFEYLLQPDFWITVLVKTIAGICAYNVGINLVWDAEIKKNLELAENIRIYNKLKDKKQNDFEFYVRKIFNPREKKIAYVSQINRRIYLLNKFSRAKDRLLYSSDLPERQVEKEKNLYCIKRQQLENLKSDEFIERNLDSLKVKYYEVDATVFELEVDGSPTLRGVKTRGNITQEKVKATASMVLGMVMFSMILTAIGLEINQALIDDSINRFLYFALKIVADIGVICWQMFRGMLKTRKIISSALTQVYAGRNKVLTNYIQWRLETKQPETLFHQEIKSEVEIELTQEQYNALQQQEKTI